MTNLFIYNQIGVNEIVDADSVGGNDIPKNEWEIIDFKSNVVKEFAIYDDVLRVKVNDDFDEDEVLGEVDRLDEEYFGFQLK